MSELELLRKQVNELQLAVRALEEGLKAQLRVRLAELEEANAKIDVLTAQATTSQAKSNGDLARLAQLQEELASKDAALASRQEEIKRLASDSERLAEENRIMREELAKEPTDSGTTELLAELAELRNATRNSEAPLASAQEEIKRIANDNKRLDEENGKLREQLTNARTQPPQAQPSEGPYPVTFDAVSPGEFGRGHALIRLLMIALWLDLILLLLYPFPPMVGAIMILRKNGRRFVDEDAPRIASALRHVIAMEAYLHLLTDRVGISARSEDVQFAVRPSGTPTVSFASHAANL